jgi:WG containing repeat
MIISSFFRISSFSLVCFLLLSACAGSGSGEVDSDPDTWRTFYDHDNRLEGYEDKDGNIMIPSQFTLADNFENGLARVSYDGILGEKFFINSKGEKVSEGFQSVDRYYEDIPMVAETSKREYFLMDSTGKTISDYYSDIQYIEERNIFLASPICESCEFGEGTYGIMNLEGEITSDWFEYFDPINRKHFLVARKGEFPDRLHAAINNEGEVISNWYSHIMNMNSFPHGYMVRVENDAPFNCNGVIDTLGNEVIEPRFAEFAYVSGQKVMVAIEFINQSAGNRKYTLFSENYTNLGKSDFEFYCPENSDLIGYASSKSTYAYYKVNGDELEKVTDNYQMSSKKSGGTRKKFFIFKERSYSYMTYWIPEFQEGLAPVKKNGKIGFIDIDGKLVIEHTYSKVGEFKNGVCEVVKNGATINIDKKGETIE